MLVLTRKLNEEIIVGDDVVIRVLEIRKDKVRIGIEAPDEVRVDRMEVRDALDQEARAAGDAPGPVEVDEHGYPVGLRGRVRRGPGDGRP